MVVLTSKDKNQNALQQLGWEFVKLQIAGNIPFWVTYFMYAALDQIFYANYSQSLFLSTALAYILFFIVNDRWVFNSNRTKRHKSTEIRRFILFMSFTALLTFIISWQLFELFGISLYFGQFISAGLSILWTFPGLKFWVFATTNTKASPRPRHA